jgi:TPR repeat protein
VKAGGHILVVAAALVGLTGVAAAQQPASAPAPAQPPASSAGANTTGTKAPQSALSTPLAKPVVLTNAELAYLNAEAHFRAHNYGQAYLQLLPIAHGGDPRAQFLLGQISDNGLGPAQLDVKEAAHWYTLAAQKNHAEAQFVLSNAYATKRGVPLDPAAALKWLQRSAENDYLPAMISLAGLYDSGLGGLERDPAKALEWIRRAADSGGVDALLLYAQRLEQGNGIEKNEQEAEKWYRRAAARGQPAAQLWLGQRAGDGLNSTATQNIESLQWLTLAGQRGAGKIRTDAAQQRRALQQNMMPSEVAEATTRAREWKPALPEPGQKPDPAYDLPGGLNVPAQAKAPAAAGARRGG